LNSEVVIYGSSLGSPGGTGVYLQRLLEGMVSIGAEGVSVVTGSGVYRPGDIPPEPYRGGLSKVLAENARIPSRLRSHGVSLVHLPAFGGRPPANTPYVVTLHDLAFLERPDWFPPVRSLFYRKHFSRVARGARLVMVDSDFTGSEAVRLLGLRPGIVRRVYLSTPDFTSSPDLFRSRYPSAGRDYLLYAGTVEPRKNVRSLLAAWTLIRERLPGFSLVLAGRWGWGDASLRKAIPETPGVVWTGMIPQELLRSAVSGARLLVYPSLYEGFGLPPLEAASAGVPSVLGPAAALREVYGSCATFCGESPDSIADAVIEAMGNTADPAELRTFAGGFSMESTARNVMDVYREALQ
jgi:glycosyltransferase involved in cell wall biosynthesis